MAKANIEISMVRYCIVFFPVARLTVLGDSALLKVLGIPVYKRYGNDSSLFGYTWCSPDAT